MDGGGHTERRDMDWERGLLLLGLARLRDLRVMKLGDTGVGAAFTTECRKLAIEYINIKSVQCGCVL